MTMTGNPQPNMAVTIDPNDPFPNVEARPLQLPDFVNIKPKNPAISLRWVNRSVGVQGSTQRLDEMIYAGFVPATAAEVCMPNGAPIMTNLIKDGKIIRGDLILMKIAREAYDGALKYNWSRAVARLVPHARPGDEGRLCRTPRRPRRVGTAGGGKLHHASDRVRR